METLIIRKSLNGYVFLVDSKGYKLSWFESVDAARKWCAEHGYKVREEEGK